MVVKNPPANTGDVRDAGPFPGSGRSSGREYGNPLQYSCLENPTDRGAWRATVHGAAKRRIAQYLSGRRLIPRNSETGPYGAQKWLRVILPEGLSPG